MPTYAYACTQCGHQFDAVQSFSDDSLTTCPECSGVLRKQYGAVGVVFKGSGFYRNDSRAGTASDSSGSTSTASDSSSTGSSNDSSESSTSTAATSASDTSSSSTGSTATGGSSTAS